MLQEELGALEPVREGLANGLGDDPGPGKADERPRLGQDDIAEHREARGDAARGRVSQERDVGQPLLAQSVQRRGGLRHLHEGEDAFLHPRAARRRHDEERDAFLNGQLDGPRQLLTHHRGHAAAQEVELEHGDGHRIAADAAEPGDDRFFQPRLAAGRLQAVRVLLGVLEPERIARAQAGLALLERAVVDEGRDPLPGADPEGVVALGADAAGAVDLGAVDDLLAGLALDPEPLGDHHLLRALLAGLALPPPEPRHPWCSGVRP